MRPEIKSLLRHIPNVRNLTQSHPDYTRWVESDGNRVVVHYEHGLWSVDTASDDIRPPHYNGGFKSSDLLRAYRDYTSNRFMEVEESARYLKQKIFALYPISQEDFQGQCGISEGVVSSNYPHYAVNGKTHVVYDKDTLEWAVSLDGAKGRGLTYAEAVIEAENNSKIKKAV